ncbi:DoxX family protein [Phytomonospora sp. NPDC050363]|uniref:DoxX family protein n=1 Tax=Phytomonospora sp. NPDC050363 TaxID=3155642 RepID=UPI0033D22049
MQTAYLIITILTAALNALIAIADLAGVRYVRDNAQGAGVPQSWIPMLGVLKLAGAVGLVIGMLGVEWIGIAAAVGLVLFFIGAVVAHIRASAYSNIAVPVAFLALAAGSLALGVLR